MEETKGSGISIMDPSVRYLLRRGYPEELIDYYAREYDMPPDLLAQAERDMAKEGRSGAQFRPEEWQKRHPDVMPLLLPAAQVPYTEPDWLIEPYFLTGKGTLIQADNGMGKTAFICAVAACVSAGKDFLGLRVHVPGPVLILSVEDDPSVLRGRIEACGGNLDNCLFMPMAADMTLNDPRIEEAVRVSGARLLIFDPLQAFLGRDVDMNRANHTRPELARLFDMCERNFCACAILAHMGKASADKAAVNRATGSVDIPAAMRSILQIERDPENPDDRLALHIKCSNAKPGRTIRYAVGERGGVILKGFEDIDLRELQQRERRVQTQEKAVPYEREPLVQLFAELMRERPAGGFWSYGELKEQGVKLLGFPLFDRPGDLKVKLSAGLGAELMRRDGIRVSAGEMGPGAKRGVRVERYTLPEDLQYAMENCPWTE